MGDLCVVFDLDDTLYKEIEFVKSAYHYIANLLLIDGVNSSDAYNILFEAYKIGKNAFNTLNERCGLDISIDEYLRLYRFHKPTLIMDQRVLETLTRLKESGALIGIITDGRECTQRNKIEALGLEKFIDITDIVISESFGSEKPDVKNYKYFMKKYPDIEKFVYVGDNTTKDFVSPNKLGWLSVGLKDNGDNIHKNHTIDNDYQPQLWIDNISELCDVLSM